MYYRKLLVKCFTFDPPPKVPTKSTYLLPETTPKYENRIIFTAAKGKNYKNQKITHIVVKSINFIAQLRIKN